MTPAFQDSLLKDGRKSGSSPCGSRPVPSSIRPATTIQNRASSPTLIWNYDLCSGLVIKHAVNRMKAHTILSTKKLKELQNQDINQIRQTHFIRF